MNTLFGRTFLGIASALVLLSVVMGAFFYVGLQRSVAVWNVNRTQHLQSTVAQEVLRVSRQEGTLYEDRLAQALDRFLTPGVSMVILSPEQAPVFIFENGDRLDPDDTQIVRPILEELGRTRNPALAVFDQDQIVAYLAVNTLGFRSDLSNRMFINSMIVSITIAILLSLGFAMGLALFISRQLTGQARALSVGLQDLARGSRTVAFARSGPAELQTIAEAAHALQGQLTRGEQLRNQWMQDVAHDLRTPITALSTQLEGMIEGVLEPSTERLESVHQELQRVENLVRNLRELSKVESPELDFEEQPVRLDHLVETVLERLRMRRDATDTTWDITLNPAQCVGDASLLLRALTNIVENALVHGKPGTTVSVESYVTNSSAGVRVTNVGFIAREHLPHLFDRLFRGDPGRSKPGSGLGLAIAHAIITRHGGEISVDQVGNKVVVDIQIECSAQSPAPRGAVPDRQSEYDSAGF